tara:strand:+ start:371 stop:661 length:291 start_codon:yes stop_codon:yes gene_type:complete
MIKVLIGDAIMSINPDAQVTIRGGDIDTCTFEWDSSPEISRAEIKAKMESMAYIPKRQTSYPSIQEQLDMQYWDKINSTTTWQDAITKVKTDNPKG